MSTAAATRRALAPLATVTVAAFLFAFLLILVRLQWAPLESADHRAAAGLNSLVAGAGALMLDPVHRSTTSRTGGEEDHGS
jgi:hypothetical protein